MTSGVSYIASYIELPCLVKTSSPTPLLRLAIVYDASQELVSQLLSIHFTTLLQADLSSKSSVDKLQMTVRVKDRALGDGVLVVAALG